MDFHTLAAQVIPVLYLALLFESGSLTRRPDPYSGDEDDASQWNASQAIARITLTLLMGVGEIAAVVAVWKQSTPAIVDALIFIALLAGLLGVTLPPILTQIEFIHKYRKEGGPYGPLFLMGVLMVALLGFALKVLTPLPL